MSLFLTALLCAVLTFFLAARGLFALLRARREAPTFKADEQSHISVTAALNHGFIRDTVGRHTPNPLPLETIISTYVRDLARLGEDFRVTEQAWWTDDDRAAYFRKLRRQSFRREVRKVLFQTFKSYFVLIVATAVLSFAVFFFLYGGLASLTSLVSSLVS